MANLTDEDRLVLSRGNSAESLLAHPAFHEVVEDLSQNHLHAIVHSRDPDTDGRERSFRQLRALQDLVGELTSRVAAKNLLLSDLEEDAGMSSDNEEID